MTEQRKENMRAALIEAAIYVIAHEGLDGATTKALATKADLNEAYIYRLYQNKTDMFAKTFAVLDQELAAAVLKSVDCFGDPTLALEEKCFISFSQTWSFLLSGRDRCLCFMRYYYSTYFSGESSELHKKTFAYAIERFKPAFREGVDVWRILNYILDIMLAGAIRVFRGDMQDTPETTQEVFDLLYGLLESNLNWTKQASHDTDNESVPQKT